MHFGSPTMATMQNLIDLESTMTARIAEASTGLQALHAGVAEEVKSTRALFDQVKAEIKNLQDVVDKQAGLSQTAATSAATQFLAMASEVETAATTSTTTTTSSTS